MKRPNVLDLEGAAYGEWLSSLETHHVHELAEYARWLEATYMHTLSYLDRAVNTVPLEFHESMPLTTQQIRNVIAKETKK